MEPTVMRDAHGNSFWVTKTFMQPETSLDPVSDPLALDVKPSSVKLEPGLPWQRDEPNPLDTTLNQFEINLDTASDPLALDVKPKPESSSVKLEPGLCHHETQLESTFVSSTVLRPITDPLDITDRNVPMLTSPMEQNSTSAPRSPPRFVPIKRSTRQARSIEPSAMNIRTEPPSVMQDSSPQGILPDSRSAEDRSSSVFNEAPQPAVARSDSTDNQVFDSVSSPCRSDCVDSESRDDDSIQHTSDTSLAVKFILKQCSVSLRRASLSSTHTAPVIDSDSVINIESRDDSQDSMQLTSDSSFAVKYNLKQCSVSLRKISDQVTVNIRDSAKLQLNSTPLEIRVSSTNTASIKPHQCTQCDYRSRLKSELVIHMRRHTGERPYACNVCTYKSASSKCLMIHKLLHSSVKLYKCSQCNYESNTKGHLATHLLSHTGERPYTCNVCSFNTVSISLLKTHKLIHSLVKRYKCSQCNYESHLKPGLVTHMLSHSGERPFACDACSFRSATRTGLAQHKHVHSTNKKFQCGECAFRTHLKGNLLLHLRRHFGERPFACDICTYKTCHGSHLIRHKLTHLVEKDFQCRQCDYKSHVKWHFDRHVRAHGGEGSFACRLCSYRCVSGSSLSMHKRVHSGNKPYKCDICNFSSAFEESLTSHVHVTEKPFNCSKCSFGTHTKSTFLIHLRTHSEVRKFACDICSYRSKTKASLYSHIMTHLRKADTLRQEQLQVHSQ